MRRLAALQESESEGDSEDESTARLRPRDLPIGVDTPKAVEQRGLVTHVRLSNMFGDWLRPSSPTTNRNSVVATHENRKSVSEPKPASSSRIIEKTDSSDVSEDERDGDFDAAFEEMMVIGTLACLGSLFLTNNLRMILA